MFVAALVQQKMEERGNKGLTVLILRYRLPDALSEADP
jgi:hypothetical protein